MAYLPITAKSVSTVGESADKGLDEKTKWVIVGVSIAVLAILSIGLYFLINKLRARKYKKAQGLEPSPYGEFARARKLSNAERMEEEETQRAVMIRKSLATRSTVSSMSSMMSRYSNIPPMDEEEEIDLNDERPPHGLREDWKEFEARITRERSNAREAHPIMAQDAGITPPQSRTVSPGHSPYLRPHPSPTSVPPRYPIHPPPGLHPAFAVSPPLGIREDRETPYPMTPLQPVRLAHVARI